MKNISLPLGLVSALCAAAVAGAASAPVLKIAPPTVSGSAYYSGGTLWFRPDGTGSFTLTATASGVTSVQFPDVSSTTGWATATGGVDMSSPYASPVPYNWSQGAAAPGAQKITAKTGTEDLTAALSISADSTPPTGQTIALVDGPFFATTTVPLAISRGSDAASGIDASGDVVERATAPLQNGACGTFGAFSAVTLAGGADTSVATGNCFRWQLKVKDHVGNVSSAATSADAKVDTTPPAAPSLQFTGLVDAAATGNVVYYRPSAAGSFTISAAATDPESGVASYAFPSISGVAQVVTQGSKTFSFSSMPPLPATPLVVTATNGAGLTSAATSFSLVPDSTPPTLAARCNGASCSTKPYSGPVRVTIQGADSPGSGLDTIRYTMDGTVPTKHTGLEYTSGIVIRSLTQLRVRAFDRVGNETNPLSLTVRSLADRLVFAAPVRVSVAAASRYLTARLTLTQRAKVVAVMSGRGLDSPQRWSFTLEHGAWIVKLRIRDRLARGRQYTMRWTVSAGSRRIVRLTQVSLR